MQPRTIFLCRLIGLYCILVALSMMLHRETTVEIVTALLRNSPLVFFVGIVTLASGLAMVLAHNLWSGGAPVIVITLVAWSAVIKGLLFLFLPPPLEAEFFLRQLHYAQLFYVYSGFSLLLGVYLAYAGLKATVQG